MTCTRVKSLQASPAANKRGKDAYPSTAVQMVQLPVVQNLSTHTRVRTTVLGCAHKHKHMPIPGTICSFRSALQEACLETPQHTQRSVVGATAAATPARAWRRLAVSPPTLEKIGVGGSSSISRGPTHAASDDTCTIREGAAALRAGSSISVKRKWDR